MDALKPPVTVLCKLGSIVVHAEEMNSADGHPFDKIALDGLMNDPEVQAWMTVMRSMAMLPLKRKA